MCWALGLKDAMETPSPQSSQNQMIGLEVFLRKFPQSRHSTASIVFILQS